jgi:hypothetical protein
MEFAVAGAGAVAADNGLAMGTVSVGAAAILGAPVVAGG